MVQMCEIQKIIDQYEDCEHYNISMEGLDYLNIYLNITEGEHLIDVTNIKSIHFFDDKSITIDFLSGGYIAFDYNKPHVSIAF